jgi:hypothetical protein
VGGAAIQSVKMAAMAFSQTRERPEDPNPRLALRNSTPTSLTSPVGRPLHAKLAVPSLGSSTITELSDVTTLEFGVRSVDQEDDYLQGTDSVVNPPSYNKKRKRSAEPDSDATETRMRSKIEELSSTLFGEGTISM